MSTDLQLCHELPKLQIAPIKTAAIHSSDDELLKQNDKVSISTVEEKNDESCRTPTSKESRIPEMLTCPPAPRKKRDETMSFRKRKLADEFRFVQVVNIDDVEAFFRSAFPKRSCRCT